MLVYCVRIYMHASARVRVYMHASARVYAYICMLVYCVRVYMHASVIVYAYICMLVLAYAYIFTAPLRHFDEFHFNVVIGSP